MTPCLRRQNYEVSKASTEDNLKSYFPTCERWTSFFGRRSGTNMRLVKFSSKPETSEFCLIYILESDTQCTNVT